MARASALHAGGQRFESVILHFQVKKLKVLLKIIEKFIKLEEVKDKR